MGTEPPETISLFLFRKTIDKGFRNSSQALKVSLDIDTFCGPETAIQVGFRGSHPWDGQAPQRQSESSMERNLGNFSFLKRKSYFRFHNNFFYFCGISISQHLVQPNLFWHSAQRGMCNTFNFYSVGCFPKKRAALH